MVASALAAVGNALPDTFRPPRYALPGLEPGGVDLEASFAELCATLDAYYFNTLFEDLGVASFDLTVGMDLSLVRPRGLYNPIKTIVDFYEQHVLTGRMVAPPPTLAEIIKDSNKATDSPTGDLWIETQNKSLIAPIGNVWKWSNFQTNMALVARNAANYGNALLVVTEEPGLAGKRVSGGKVYIENLHPASLVDYDRHKRGHYTYAKIDELDYERNEKGEKVYYVLSRIYYKNRIEIQKDGKPFDRYGFGASWENPHGFVPVVMIRHEELTGDDRGLNSYVSALSIVNEMALTASIVGTQIGMHIDPQWVAIGATPPADGVLRRDGNVWFMPNGSGIEPLIADLDIAGAYLHINRLYDLLENQQPELLLPMVGDDKRDVSGAAVRGILTGLIRRGLKARERYEAGIKDAVQMALSMGSNFGGTNQSLWGVDIPEFGDDKREFEFHWPDILPLSPLERKKLEADEIALQLTVVNSKIQIDQAIKDNARRVALENAPIDPATGFPIDPKTLQPTDPSTLQTVVPDLAGISSSVVPSNDAGGNQ